MGRARSLTPLVRILVLTLALLSAAVFSGEAKAQRVNLEISPAVARNEPALTGLIRAVLPREIQKNLAGRFKGTIRVRINDAKLPRQPGFGIAGRDDFLDGVGIVPGRDPIPIRLTLPFERSMFAFTPEGEAHRANNLVEVFAQWVGKYL